MFVATVEKRLFNRVQRVWRFMSYKSPYNIDNLYPNSTTSQPVAQASQKSDKFDGVIPLDKLQFTYSKSSGPGGQNVNKLNTKVVIRFHVPTADFLSDTTRSKLLEENVNITKDGFLVVKSERTRTQLLNQADALDKLRNIIWECEKEPPQPSIETFAIKKERLEVANRDRLRTKRIKSDVKRSRQMDID